MEGWEMKRGSITLARRLCYEIAGPTDEEDDITGSDYDSVEIAEILSAEIESLRQQLADSQKHVTLLRDVLGQFCGTVLVETRWSGDPLYNAAQEALATTADLAGVILCHAEPVGIGSKARGIGEDYQPLYRAWEPK